MSRGSRAGTPFRRGMSGRQVPACAGVRLSLQSPWAYPNDTINVQKPLPSTLMPQAMAPHVVIVGGGFGGLEAAQALAGAPVSVTLIDRHNYHLFQPLLYQVATASLSPGDIASPIRWVLRHQENVEVLLAGARGIDLASRRVVIDPPGQLPFDYLIIATGSAHAYFGHPEWASRAPGLKTLDDALEIRRQILLAFEAAERESDPDARPRLLTFV